MRARAAGYYQSPSRRPPLFVGPRVISPFTPLPPSFRDDQGIKLCSGGLAGLQRALAEGAGHHRVVQKYAERPLTVGGKKVHPPSSLLALPLSHSPTIPLPPPPHACL